MNDFEQKLAAFRPKMLRDIVPDVLRTPEIETIRAKPWNFLSIWRYAGVGLASFLLGVAVTYFALKPTEAPSKSVAVSPVSVQLDEQDIDRLRSPSDLTRLLARKTPPAIKAPLHPESRNIQYRTLYLEEIEHLERRESR